MDISDKKIDSEWIKFKDEYRQDLKDPDEIERRRKIFAENYKMIAIHEQPADDNDEYTPRLGVTPFTDMTNDEFSDKYLCSMSIEELNEHGKMQITNVINIDSNDVPESIDWRTHGGINSVIDETKVDKQTKANIPEQTKDLSEEEIENKWLQYMNEYRQKLKDPDEIKRRRTIFTEKYKWIAQVMKKMTKWLNTYRIGITRFADMTPAECDKYMSPISIENYNKHINNQQTTKDFVINQNIVLDSIDLRERGVITRVKHQPIGCSILAAIDTIESHYAIINKCEPLKLSTQHLVDNINLKNVGFIEEVYKNVIEQGGLMLERDYQSGRPSGNFERITLKSYEAIYNKDEDYLKQVISTIGPVAVVIRVNWEIFKYYKGGIFFDQPIVTQTTTTQSTSKQTADKTLSLHTVVVVGYGTELFGDKKQDYWIIKNNWSENWGENGYMKLSRFQKDRDENEYIINQMNTCGICTLGIYYPKDVHQV